MAEVCGRGPVGLAANQPQVDSGTLARAAARAPGPSGAAANGPAPAARPAACPSRTKGEETLVLYFGQNSRVVAGPELDKLKRLEAVLRRSGTRVALHGHASLEGSDRYNLTLSRDRAEFVEAYLVAMGGSPGQLKVEAFGERRPAVAEQGQGAELEARRAKNRRVEVRFVVGNPYVDYVATIRKRYQGTIANLRRRLQKLQAAERRTLAHPAKLAIALRHWQEEIDETQSELKDYERWLAELDAAQQTLKDPKKVWDKVTRRVDYFDEMIRMQDGRIQSTEQRLSKARMQAAQAKGPQEKAFWTELGGHYQEALKDQRKELQWLHKDKSRQAGAAKAR